MREARCVSLIPRTTLHSDSEHWYTYYRKIFILLKGTPWQKEHKTSFGILTMNELNLPVKFTKSSIWRALYIQFHLLYYIYNIRATSYEVKDTKYDLWIRNTRYKITPERRMIIGLCTAPGPSFDSTVQIRTIHWKYWTFPGEFPSESYYRPAIPYTYPLSGTGPISQLVAQSPVFCRIF